MAASTPVAAGASPQQQTPNIMRKDKAKVVDEVWSDERVRSFLDRQPPAGVDADHHALLTAYQSMRAEDFARLVALFSAAGRNLDARDANGNSVADIIGRHRRGAPYLAVLDAFRESMA